VRAAGDRVHDRSEEAAAGIRQGDGNSRGPDRDHHIRAVVAVEIAERWPSGHAGDDRFSGAEVRLSVVATEDQIVADDDGEILIAVAIDVHRGKRSLEREREARHQGQRAGPVVREQPEVDRMHRCVVFAGRDHVGVRITVEVRYDVHPGRRRRRESRCRESAGTIVQEHVDTAGVGLVGGDGIEPAVVVHIHEADNRHLAGGSCEGSRPRERHGAAGCERDGGLDGGGVVLRHRIGLGRCHERGVVEDA
jgi:hypothetical protein